MKNSNDTIGNRTRDLPACSAMPQYITVRSSKYDLFHHNSHFTSNSTVQNFFRFLCRLFFYLYEIVCILIFTFKYSSKKELRSVDSIVAVC